MELQIGFATEFCVQKLNLYTLKVRSLQDIFIVSKSSLQLNLIRILILFLQFYSYETAGPGPVLLGTKLCLSCAYSY